MQRCQSGVFFKRNSCVIIAELLLTRLYPFDSFNAQAPTIQVVCCEQIRMFGGTLWDTSGTTAFQRSRLT